MFTLSCFCCSLLTVFKMIFFKEHYQYQTVGIPGQDQSSLYQQMTLAGTKPTPLGPRHKKHVFGGFQTTKSQISLHICHMYTVTPLLFAKWKVPYLDLFPAKFQFSS